MKKISASLLGKVHPLLPKKHRKADINYYNKEGTFMNLYDKNKKYITSVSSNVLTETVHQRIGTATVGRPKYQTYEIRKKQRLPKYYF